MKKILIYSIIPVLVLISGCIKDDRNNFMVDDSITLTTSSDLQDVSCHTGSYTFGVAKSGKGFSVARATVSPDVPADILEEFNAEHRRIDFGYEDVEVIPSDKYSIEGGNISWAASDFLKTVTVSWNPGVIADFIGDKTNCAIVLVVSSSDLEVNAEKRLVVLRMSRSSLSLKQTIMSYEVSKPDVEPSSGGATPVLTKTLTFDLEIDSPIKNVALNVPVAVDNSLIAAFNEEQGETYQAAPEGLFTLSTDSVSLEPTERSKAFKGVLDYSVLLSGGKLNEFPSYVIPVSIDIDGVGATKNGEAFDVGDLLSGNRVVYITVVYKHIDVSDLVVVRKWGKYSTASAAWNGYFGGKENSDRNVAMDDEYIYVVENGNTDPESPNYYLSKKIWAIKISDPSDVHQLPVGTLLDNGISYVSCPRVIPNTDESVNGGKDVLVVSNLQEGDPTLYAYVNGTGSDPKVIGTQTWASRRLGDTFTFAGTLQDGVFFFKDYNTAQGTVTFPIKYTAATSTLNLVRRLEAPAVTGAGSYFPFPDNMYKGVSSARGNGYISQIVDATGANFTDGTGGITPSLTDLSGYYQDTAFKFFEFGGMRYIAYTRQVSGSDGRFFLIDGQLSDTWERILNTRHVVYQAAIQSADEMKDDYDDSPRISGNSGMDIDAREIGGSVYVAVVKQNVGLSLFQISKNEGTD